VGAFSDFDASSGSIELEAVVSVVGPPALITAEEARRLRLPTVEGHADQPFHLQRMPGSSHSASRLRREYRRLRGVFLDMSINPLRREVATKGEIE
jgi:hypothetical protein